MPSADAPAAPPPAPVATTAGTAATTATAILVPSDPSMPITLLDRLAGTGPLGIVASMALGVILYLYRRTEALQKELREAEKVLRAESAAAQQTFTSKQLERAVEQEKRITDLTEYHQKRYDALQQAKEKEIKELYEAWQEKSDEFNKQSMEANETLQRSVDYMSSTIDRLVPPASQAPSNLSDRSRTGGGRSGRNHG